MIDLKKQKNYDWTEVLAVIVCVMSTLAMAVRCFYTTELTDEVYAISDTLAAMYGNLPFAYNASVAAGQTLVPMVFYKVYEWFVPSLEGIVLYSRLAFLAFKLVILGLIYRLLAPEISRKHRLLMVATMIPFFGSQIHNFSYNTVAAFLVLLVSVLLYSANRDSGWKQYGKLVVSGFITAFAVFTHPARAVAVFVFLLLIFINSTPSNRLRNMVVYCAGGILGILTVMVPIGLIAGFDKLVYGIETLLFHRKVANRIPDFTRWERFYLSFQWGGKYWVALLAGTVCGCLSLNYLARRKGKTADWQKNWLLSVTCITLLELLYASDFSMPGFIMAGAFVACLPLLRKKDAMDWYIILPSVGHTLFLLTFTTASYWDRFLYLTPIIMVVLRLLFSSKSKSLLRAGVVLAVVFVIQTCIWDYTFVYRDDPIPELKNQVAHGVYKGLYTTESRAKDLPELEQYLRDNISLEESVSFRDNVPVAYMLRSQNIWDVRTWDQLNWNHNGNDPTSMYRYYKNREGIPDVIAYFDYGNGRETRSIDHSAEEFQFNTFVNQYYELDSDEQVNDTFRVRIYRRNDMPDPDLDQLIESVK